MQVRKAGQPFEVFGVKPMLGRAFLPEEDKPNANQVVVLSHSIWQRDFGADRGIVGRTIELNQQPYRIIGVMGPDFRWPLQADLCVPFGLPPETFDPARNRHNQSYNTFARLRPGISFDQAAAYVKVMTEQIIQREDQLGFAKASSWGIGGGVDMPTSSTGMFVCLVDPSAGAFNVPTYLWPTYRRRGWPTRSRIPSWALACC